MEIKEHSAFPKAPALLKPHHLLFSVLSRTVVAGFYLSAEKQSVYSTPPADWATLFLMQGWVFFLIWRIRQISYQNIVKLLTCPSNFFSNLHVGTPHRINDVDISQFIRAKIRVPHFYEVEDVVDMELDVYSITYGFSLSFNGMSNLYALSSAEIYLVC